LPFVLEAGIASLAGTALAFGGLALTKFYLIDQSLAETYTFTNFIGWDAVFAVLVPMLVVGVGLAVLAAVVTLRKYLKV
jgi:cell division transport system permease protein